MLVGIDKNQRIEVTSKYDGTDPKTVFVFRPMTGAELVDLGQNGAEVKLSGSSLIDFICKSLVEVMNFEGQTENRAIIESLPADVLAELVEKVVEINHLTKQEAKN